MRPNHFFVAIFLLLYANTFSQTIYKVDSNPNATTGDHVYTDLQECIDAASNGDMIHIIPAANHYGTVTIDKELHLVGSGWVPDNQSGLTSKVFQINFDAGSSNSTLNGLVITRSDNSSVYIGVIGAPVDTVENIEIKNCLIKSLTQNNTLIPKNMIIRNNIFYGTGNYYAGVVLKFQTGAGMTENLLISNNIICPGYLSSFYSSSNITVANQTIIANNLIYGDNGANAFGQPSNAFGTIINCFISNNVFFGTAANGSASYGNVFSNNLTKYCGSGCTFPPTSTSLPNNTGINNLSNTDPLFTTISVTTYWSISFDLSVTDDSPLIDAGSDGTDIGITGGSYPFNNYQNLRAVPYIHQMAVPGIIMENQDIQLEAEARTNQ